MACGPLGETMKRTAATFLLVAGVVGVTGCMNSPKVDTKPAVMKTSDTDGRVAKDARSTEIQQAQGFRPVGQANRSEVVNAAAYGVNKVSGTTMMDPNLRRTNGGGLGNDKYPPQVFGPTQRGV